MHSLIVVLLPIVVMAFALAMQRIESSLCVNDSPVPSGPDLYGLDSQGDDLLESELPEHDSLLIPDQQPDAA